MQNENNLKYSIILPAHNEEKFLAKTLQSVVSQSHLPFQIVVVDDNSTDKTLEIAREFQSKYTFLQVISSENTSTQHLPGSKIVQAFYKGFHHLNSNWEVIVKLDADVILPPNYFEEIIQTFKNNSKIGIAGGLALIQKDENWVYENIGNKDQVRGPFKAYSKACFEKISGLKASIGWDTVDELLARFHGFEVKVLPHLEIKLQKPTGQDYKEMHAKKTGEAFYKMDYGCIISFIAAAKASWNKRSLAFFISTTKGYWNSSRKRDSKLVTKEEGKFIRSFRWKGILNRLINRS